MSKGTLNKVVIIGRLGADPDIRYNSGGTAYGRLNVATVDSVKKNDKYEDITEWHRIVVFGKQAEFCGNYMKKGNTICVEGGIRTNQWEDSDGNKRNTTEIIARDIQLIGGKSGNGDPSSSSGSKSQPKNSGSSHGSKTNTQQFDNFDPEDDIPF